METSVLSGKAFVECNFKGGLYTFQVVNLLVYHNI